MRIANVTNKGTAIVLTDKAPGAYYYTIGNQRFSIIRMETMENQWVVASLSNRDMYTDPIPTKREALDVLLAIANDQGY